jgi:hypothetical protein
LKAYDTTGKEVQTLVAEFQEQNRYSLNFDAHTFASSVYFYRLQAGDNFVETKRMMLLK